MTYGSDRTDQGVLGYKHQRPAFQSNFIVSRLMKRHPDWFLVITSHDLGAPIFQTNGH